MAFNANVLTSDAAYRDSTAGRIAELQEKEIVLTKKIAQLERANARRDKMKLFAEYWDRFCRSFLGAMTEALLFIALLVGMIFMFIAAGNAYNYSKECLDDTSMLTPGTGAVCTNRNHRLTIERNDLVYMAHCRCVRE